MAQGTLNRGNTSDELEGDPSLDDQIATTAPRGHIHPSRNLGKLPVSSQPAGDKVNIDHTMSAHTSMKQALMDQSEDVPVQEMAKTTPSEVGKMSALDKTRGLHLLALENGVVRGLSALYVLKGLMDRLNSGLEGRPARRPCEVFDLIGGTGTGG
jgi:hypothetical protein